MDSRDTKTLAPVIPRRESGVLFDDDYRKHIQLLNTKLARERQDVIRLREKVARLEEEKIDLQTCINILRMDEKKKVGK